MSEHLRLRPERTCAPVQCSVTRIDLALPKAGSAAAQPSRSSALRFRKRTAASGTDGPRYGKRQHGLNRRWFDDPGLSPSDVARMSGATSRNNRLQRLTLPDIASLIQATALSTRYVCGG